eukprot:183803-Prorocentrum_minimum.AAC.1
MGGMGGSVSGVSGQQGRLGSPGHSTPTVTGNSAGAPKPRPVTSQAKSKKGPDRSVLSGVREIPSPTHEFTP